MSAGTVSLIPYQRTKESESTKKETVAIMFLDIFSQGTGNPRSK